MKKCLIIKKVIEKCQDCDYIYCGCCEKKKLKSIENIYTIPKWCPLEDYKDGQILHSPSN